MIATSRMNRNCHSSDTTVILTATIRVTLRQYAKPVNVNFSSYLTSMFNILVSWHTFRVLWESNVSKYGYLSFLTNPLQKNAWSLSISGLWAYAWLCDTVTVKTDYFKCVWNCECSVLWQAIDFICELKMCKCLLPPPPPCPLKNDELFCLLNRRYSYDIRVYFDDK